jgi:hypothetical protein
MATFLDRAVRVDAVVVRGEMDLALKEITVLEDLLAEKYFLRRASATGLTCTDPDLYQRPLGVTHRRSLTVMAGLSGHPRLAGRSGRNRGCQRALA